MFSVMMAIVSRPNLVTNLKLDIYIYLSGVWI